MVSINLAAGAGNTTPQKTPQQGKDCNISGMGNNTEMDQLLKPYLSANPTVSGEFYDMPNKEVHITGDEFGQVKAILDRQNNTLVVEQTFLDNGGKYKTEKTTFLGGITPEERSDGDVTADYIEGETTHKVTFNVCKKG